MERFWPGPLALLIFKAKADLPSYLKGADGTIALRIPAHAGLQQLLVDCEGLFSTSANKEVNLFWYHWMNLILISEDRWLL